MTKRVVCVAVLGALLVGLSAQSVLAQGRGAGRGTPLTGQAYVDSLKTRLNLTDAQAAKVKTLVDIRDAAVAAAPDDRTARRDAYTAFMTALRGPDVGLSAEQLALLGGGGRGMGAGGGGILVTATRLDGAVRGLQLSADVQARVDQMRAERDKQLETAVNAYRDRIMPLLTPEQQAQLKAAEQSAAGTGMRGGTRGAGRGRGRGTTPAPADPVP